MSSAGIEGHFTNTSLRRTACTRMMESNIPDKIARKVSGHMSSAEEVYISASSKVEDISTAIYGGGSTIKEISTSVSGNKKIFLTI
jgi:hypothetical protein